jgi:hypothetical protein
MKNPCDICLIKTMCGTMCSNKIEYGKYWQKQFETICRKHIYTSDGHLRNNKGIKKEILNLKEKIIKRLDNHRTEILTILLREHGTFE